MKEGKRQNQGEKNRYFCVEHGGVHFVAIIKAGQPPVCLDDVASYQKQTTELKRLKGQGTLHNAKKLKFLCISTYIRPMALPFLPFFFFIRFLSSSSDVYVVPVQGEKKKERKKKREKEITLPINANTEWGATYAPVK